jgi:hypothetical protein
VQSSGDAGVFGAFQRLSDSSAGLMSNAIKLRVQPAELA